jgi:hypothetical protein
MTVIVKHNKTNSITDWTQAQLDEQIALGNFPSGTTLANIVLPSDWNNDHTLTGLGTMAEQDATAVAITGGTINNTTIGATTASTGRFTSVTTPSVTATTLDLALNSVSTGSVNFSSAGGQLFKISDGGAYGGYWNAFSASGSPSLRAIGNVSGAIDTNSAVPIQFRTNLGTSGAEQFRVGHTASAVNYVNVTGGATSNSPVISAQGSDAAVALSITSKGTNAIRFLSNNAANLQFRIVGTNTAVNNLAVTGTIATNAPSLSSEGSDTNISMAFQPKGTGAIDLAAGSSGVNISNGGTVTAITRTAAGSAYTSFPTMAISAPTTAGGVQATATFTMGLAGVPTITNGGTGYTVGNTLTFVGGSGGTATLTVSTVSSGVITGVTVAGFGLYTALPSNPISVTGGSGSGATFTATWAINSGFTITNAGSGYIEQPTITFSGGGGSGATAYATVGSSVRLQSLGTTSELAFAFRGASGINSPTAPDILRILDVAAANDAGIFIQNSGFGRAQIQAYGNANANLFLCANGSGRVTFTTSGTSLVEQMRVSHTASAVNYVQVTGSATANIPIISTTGSDASVGMELRLKGTPTGPGFRVTNNNGSNVCFAVTTSVATPANYMRADPASASASPAMSAQGSDTNIDLALTPKGTGLVRFGTYVAGALTATGYINIKAADGTTYKVLVST